ncbi:MAG: dehypoxanthine futalosine cyclase [Negativicutes bacterium]|nr:dehypoxanthine futalosine cyclase [Negativicutes bacterium]
MNSRLGCQEAEKLLTCGDILELGRKASAVRQRLHPGNLVTFIIDRNINYTNICDSQCRFCAFYRRPGEPGAYVLSLDDILAKTGEAVAAGATQIMLQGGLNPELGFDYYLEIITAIRERYPVAVHSFSPAEVLYTSRLSGKSVHEVLLRLKDAGLASLPGGGAEILDDEVRSRVSPRKISAGEWLAVMRTAHEIGLRSTATMVIGMGETMEHRVNHLRKIRELQDETGGFRAFIMWSYQPGNTELGGNKTSTWDYLRTLAVARLFLDNVAHIQGSWVTQGEQVGQLTLAFGANDLGSIMLEENVVRAAGTSHAMSLAKMTALIESAGFIPAQRDTAYNVLRRFDRKE